MKVSNKIFSMGAFLVAFTVGFIILANSGDPKAIFMSKLVAGVIIYLMVVFTLEIAKGGE